jgi:hypothetical protein
MNELSSLKRDVYTIRTEGDGYRVTKLNSDLTPVSFYAMSLGAAGEVKCTCPQSNRGPCRHLDILDAFTELYPERVNSGWLYCYDTKDWFPPVDAAAEPGGEAVSDATPPASQAVAPEVEGALPPSGAFNRRGL